MDRPALLFCVPPHGHTTAEGTDLLSFSCVFCSSQGGDGCIIIITHTHVDSVNYYIGRPLCVGGERRLLVICLPKLIAIRDSSQSRVVLARRPLDDRNITASSWPSTIKRRCTHGNVDVLSTNRRSSMGALIQSSHSPHHHNHHQEHISYKATWK